MKMISVDKHSIIKTANNCHHGKTTIQWEYNLNSIKMAAINREHVGHLKILLKHKCTLINLWLLNFVNVSPC